MGSNRDKCCFTKGKFFVLLDPNSKTGRWIALGPDRKITIPFTILLLLSSLLANYVFKYSISTTVACVTVLSYIWMFLSYLYTSLLDPGIIKASEDNSIENRMTLEPLGYSFCSICNLYRSPKGYHCQDCGVCFNNHDHHCSFMGQCVAKKNVWSFYSFIISLLVFLISVEVGVMTAFTSQSNDVARNVNALWIFIGTLFSKSKHLRTESLYLCLLEQLNNEVKFLCN